jgi:hypothetical protein
MTSDEYQRELRERYQAAFLEGLGVPSNGTISKALASPEVEELPSIPLSREEQIALGALRRLVALGVLRPDPESR